MYSSRAGIDRTVPASPSELMSFEGVAEATIVKPDEVAKADPMAMSRVMPLSEVVKVQNEHIDHLEQTKKELEVELATKKSESNHRAAELYDQKRLVEKNELLVAEKAKQLAEAAAKQEELEKELGLRAKTEAEKLGRRKAEIRERMEEAGKLAGAIIKAPLIPYDNGQADALRGKGDKDGSWTKSDSFYQNLLSLTLKIYDELKVAEGADKEKEKPKLTDEELRALVVRVDKLAIVSGAPNQVDAAMATALLHYLMK